MICDFSIQLSYLAVWACFAHNKLLQCFHCSSLNGGDEKVDEVASFTNAFRGMCCMLNLAPEVRQRPEFKILLESAAKFKIQDIDLMIAELTAE